MNDISDILRTLIDNYNGQTADVDRSFTAMLEEDPQLQSDYKNWCEDNGYDLKSGYQEYVDELVESRDSIWENLGDE